MADAFAVFLSNTESEDDFLGFTNSDIDRELHAQHADPDGFVDESAGSEEDSTDDSLIDDGDPEPLLVRQEAEAEANACAEQMQMRPLKTTTNGLTKITSPSTMDSAVRQV